MKKKEEIMKKEEVKVKEEEFYGAKEIKTEPVNKPLPTLFKIEEKEGINIKDLLKRGQKARKAMQRLGDFEEPVALLIRRNGNVEFFEGVKDCLEFIHTDGTKVRVNLPPNKILTFSYANRRFKGYIHNEDKYLPEPEQASLDAESVDDIFKKALTSRKLWEEERKLEKEKRQSKMIVVWIILAVLGGITAILMFGGTALQGLFAPAAQQVLPAIP